MSLNKKFPRLLPSSIGNLFDENTMACEDLVLADLDGDGKLDIIAAGRATKNVKIYWNAR